MPDPTHNTNNVDSPYFYDVAKVVDPQSPQGKKFAADMEALTKRLLGTKYDPAKHGYRFFLADDPTANAYAKVNTDPRVIVLHKGLLEKVHSLDELAGVLAHEIGHQMATDKLGEHSNSKAEELSADLHALKLLADAGLNGQAAENLVSRLRDERESSADNRNSAGNKVAQALFDVHPIDDNRVASLQKARVILERQGHVVVRPDTPMPAEWLENARSGSYHSTTDIHARMAAEHYETLPIKGQLDWLAAEAERLTKLDSVVPYNPNDYAARNIKPSIESVARQLYKDQLHKTFAAISVVDTPDIHEYYQETLNRLLRSGLWPAAPIADDYNTSNNLYQVALEGFYGKKVITLETIDRTRPAIGVFRDFKTEIYAYAAAQSPEEAEIHAKKILELYKHYEVALKAFDSRQSNAIFANTDIGRWNYTSIEEARQKISAGERVHIPLLRHELWAETNPALQSVNNLLLGEAPLVQPGKVDDWLVGRDDYIKSFEIVDGQVASVLATARPSIEHFSTGNGADSRNEKRYSPARQKWEQGILDAGVDWSLLKTNPDQFIRIYQSVVVPAAHLPYSYPHPFAHAFMEYIHNEAELYPAIMTLEARTKIFNEISAYRAGSTPYPDTGIDINHPYIKEYKFLHSAGQNPSPVLLRCIRINPLDHNDDLTIPKDGLNLNQNDQRQSAIESVYVLDECSQTLARLESHKDHAPRLGDMIEMYATLKTIKGTYISRDGSKEVARARAKVIDPLIASCSYQIERASDNIPFAPLAELIDDYHRSDFDGQKSISHRTVSDSPELYALKNRLGRILVERISAIEDVDSRRQQLKALLRGKDTDGNSSSFESPDPDTRKKLATALVEDIHAYMDHLLDDGSATYAEKLSNYITSLREDAGLSGQLHSEVISAVAEKVQAQPTLAKELKTTHDKNAAKNMFENDDQARFAEGLLEDTKSDPRRRAALLEFLSHPLSDASIKSVYKTMNGEKNTLLERTRRSRAGILNEMGDAKVKDAFEKFHKTFWDQPLPIRAALLTDIIFPQGIANETAEHITDRMLDRILGNGSNRPFSRSDMQTQSERLEFIHSKIEKANERAKEELGFERSKEKGHISYKDIAQLHVAKEIFIPIIKHTSVAGVYVGDGLRQINDQLSRTGDMFKPGVNHKNAETAKLIVKSYIETVGSQNPKEAQMLVAALLSAEHQRAPGEVMRLGQTLNIVLSNMGPAGAKLLQAIHSNPSTPEDIRNDLKYSKIDHDKPARWDAIDMMETAGLLDPSKTSHVGKCIGAGSFGITMLNTAADGKDYADTLLRPNADAMADREFQFMEQAAKIIAQQDSRMKPVIDMVQQARHSAQIETQMSLAEKQNQIAQQSMDGVVVKVKGADGVEHTYTHRVMPLIEQNEHYKRAEFAPGTEYLKLPENTPIEYRRNIAYAMASMQLTQRLAGMPMDRDRHGGNIKVEGDQIYHYDFGMTDLELPSDTQKEALGKVLAKTVKQVAQSRVNLLNKIVGGKETAFVDALVNNIDKSDAGAPERAFLTKFKQEVLAMADYFNALETGDQKKSSSKQAMEGIMGQALYGEQVDPIIKASFTKELGTFGASMARKHFATAMANSPVTLENLPRMEQLVMPVLSPEEAVIVSGRKTNTYTTEHLSAVTTATANNSSNLPPGVFVTSSEIAGVSNLDPENSNPSKTRSVRWGDVVLNPGRFYWPEKWTQRTFQSEPLEPWYSSPRDYEKAHGVKGIAGHYQLPEGMTHEGLEVLVEKEKVYHVTAMDMAQGGLPPYARTPAVHAEGQQKLPALVKTIDEIIALNPVLKNIRFDRNNREHVTEVLNGINYDFNVNDIDHFVNFPHDLKGSVSRKINADLHKAAETVGDFNWVPSPATMETIISQSSAAQEIARSLGIAKFVEAQNPSTPLKADVTTTVSAANNTFATNSADDQLPNADDGLYESLDGKKGRSRSKRSGLPIDDLSGNETSTEDGKRWKKQNLSSKAAAEAPKAQPMPGANTLQNVSPLTIQIGSHSFFNATNGADRIDFNDPVVRENLEKLAALIQDVETKTGHKFDTDIMISGKYNYMMMPGVEGEAGKLYVGTHGWAEGNISLTEGILHHEMGHHVSKNGIYTQTIGVNISANNMLDSMEHFVRTDPKRAYGWMIETFGSIENAQAFVVKLKPLVDANSLAIQPILGKTDIEIFEALKANPSLLKEIAGALDTSTSMRLITDEDLNLLGKMMDLSMQDRIVREKTIMVMDATRDAITAPAYQEFINGNPLRDFPDHEPDVAFSELVEILTPYRDNANPEGHAFSAAERAEEYLADRYALEHTSDPEAYLHSLETIAHIEVESRERFAQVQAFTGFDVAAHPAMADRVAAGRAFIGEMKIERAIKADPEKYKPQVTTRGDSKGNFSSTTTYDTPFGIKTVTETSGGAPEVQYQPARNPLELGWKQEYSREKFTNVWRIDAKDMTPRERQHVIDHLASQGVVAKEFSPLAGNGTFIDVPAGNAALKGAVAKDFGRMVAEFHTASSPPTTPTVIANNTTEGTQPLSANISDVSVFNSNSTTQSTTQPAVSGTSSLHDGDQPEPFAEFRTGDKEMLRGKRGTPVKNPFADKNSVEEGGLANKPIEKVKAAEFKAQQPETSDVSAPVAEVLGTSADVGNANISPQLAAGVILNGAANGGVMPNGQTLSVPPVLHVPQPLRPLPQPPRPVVALTAPVMTPPLSIAAPDANGPHIDADGFTAHEVVSSTLSNGSTALPKGMTIVGENGSSVHAESSAPRGAHFNGAGTAMSLSALVGIAEEYKANGGNLGTGVAVTSAALNVVDDLASNKILSGKAGLVGMIPSAINLLNAKTDDQRNAAITNLTVNGATMAALPRLMPMVAPEIAGGSLGGPLGIAVVMTASYIGDKTLTPALKIADGYWGSLSGGKENREKGLAKMEIGQERLNAGLSKLNYKLGSATGLVSLTGDVVGSAGDITKMAGGLTGDAESWLVEKLGDKNTAAALDAMHAQGIYYPGSASATLVGAGEALHWAGEKVTEFGDWVSDKTGIGKSSRDAAKASGDKADALQKKYDEAHKRQVVIPPEVVQVNAKLEAYSKSQSALVELISHKGPVDAAKLKHAQDDYKKAHAALTSDPMYGKGANTIQEQFARSNNGSLYSQSPSESTHIALTGRAAELHKEEQTKELQELELFLKNPVTPSMKNDIAQFNANADGWVAQKRTESLGASAQTIYTGIAKTQAKNAQTLQHAMDVINTTDVQIATLLQGIQQQQQQGLITEPHALEVAKVQLATIEKQRAAAQKELAEVEKANDGLIAKHKKTSGMNEIYHDNAQTKQLTKVLTDTKHTIDLAQVHLAAPKDGKLSPLQEAKNGLLALEQQMQAVQPVVTAPGVSTPALTGNEAKLQNLIAQNPAFGDKALQDKVLSEMLNLYKHGIDANGNNISKGDATLKDGQFDDKEFAAAIAKINEKFKDKGVVLSASTVPANTISKPDVSKSGAQI